MALPSIEIDWRINHRQIGNTGNGTFDYKDFWLQLKRALTNGPGWTGNWTKCDGTTGADPTPCVVTQSSDSSHADATDRWLSTTNIVQNNNADVHSWIVLTFPGIGSGAQLCIDVDNYNVSPNYIQNGSSSDGANPATAGGGIFFSHSAGFAASTMTERRPRGNSSQQDETEILNRRDFYGSTGYILGGVGTGAGWQAQMHVMRSSDGAQNRVVVYYSGLPLLFFLLDKPKSPFVTSTPHTWNVDDVPWVAGWFSSQSTSQNALSMFSTANLIGNAPFYSRICSLVNPTTRIVTQLQIGCEAYNSNTTLTNGFNVPSDIDGSYPMMPLSLISISSGYRGRVGLLYDMWNVPPVMLEGDSFPNDNSKQYVVMGDFAFPWDRSVLTVL